MQLTEDMILNRSKQSKLDTVKELNLCGYSLTDVSIVSQLPNVEVLALSVNNIRFLAPFSNCTNLKELYLRRNNIDNVNQLFYLQGVTKLKSLGLSENPFCSLLGYNYRAAVLSILPQIKVLDNLPVSNAEIERSKSVGLYFDPMMCMVAQPTPAIPLPEPKTVDEPDSNVLSAVQLLIKNLDFKSLETLHSSIEQRMTEIYSEPQEQ